VNKEQIIKDFSEIYIGQDSRQLADQYFRKKKKEMSFIFIVAVLAVLVCGINDFQSSNVENNIISRKETEGTKTEIPLQIKTEEEKWQDMVLVLYPKEYSEEELNEMYTQACKLLPELIQMENTDLNKINSDLNLVQEINGFPFFISWRSSKVHIINEQGILSYTKDIMDESVELTALFSYADWKKEFSLPVHIQAKKQENIIRSLEEDLKDMEKQTRQEKDFYLPQEYMNHSLEWRYLPGNTSLIMGLFLAVVIPLISYQKDQEIHKQTKIRKEQLKESFPDFISKLILLMEAGMSIKGALFRIGEDYRSKYDEKRNYLYEELLYVCRQMKNGLTEKEGYELLGRRCDISCYKKLSGLLIQHLQKGGNSILENLREESARASEEEKRNIQKKGEEMGTKLLFPMIMMLGIVMVFIMVPALFSFQM